MKRIRNASSVTAVENEPLIASLMSISPLVFPLTPNPVAPFTVLYWNSPPVEVRVRIPPSNASGPHEPPAHPALAKSRIVAPSTAGGERSKAPAHGRSMSNRRTPNFITSHPFKQNDAAGSQAERCPDCP